MFRTPRLFRNVTRLPAYRLSRPSYTRTYASRLSAGDEFTSSDAKRVQEIAAQIRQTPEIREKLDHFQKLLKDKGFNPSEPPSIIKLMGLLSQKDVKTALESLKQSLDANNIKLTQQDLSAFMKIYGFDKQ